jgi:hypothetical protein
MPPAVLFSLFQYIVQRLYIYGHPISIVPHPKGRSQIRSYHQNYEEIDLCGTNGNPLESEEKISLI